MLKASAAWVEYFKHWCPSFFDSPEFNAIEQAGIGGVLNPALVLAKRPLFKRVFGAFRVQLEAFTETFYVVGELLIEAPDAGRERRLESSLFFLADFTGRAVLKEGEDGHYRHHHNDSDEFRQRNTSLFHRNASRRLIRFRLPARQIHVI